ncbi:MAG: PTS glucose transporter subunit IIA [Butyrivibrio sp.]|uniref:PTS sugar transporter subunit IIA n=1 Tax=Butyrivibrio sp. TaxID=28121 RepID=UPI0025E51F6E|nr:PTS glucose transporter subunit IIA [Butyrivibrio sp.]MCR5772184.1 PTS glucose transporter subunit IIA [Butyrivibrio sp.]
MGLFDKLFQSNKIEIASPVSGEIVPIGQVSDPTFAQEMVGKGVAIIPSDGKFYAPCDGTLVALFPTGHAFCINTADGAEVLVHIGIDTVKLKGEHYIIRAKQGDTVKKGDLIVEVDLEGVKSAGYEIITPMVISNHSKFSGLEKKTGAVTSGDAAILLSK